MIYVVVFFLDSAFFLFFFFFNDPATTEIYTLSLHDALPISWPKRRGTSPCCCAGAGGPPRPKLPRGAPGDRKSTRLNSSHSSISYAVFCLKKKNKDYWYNTHDEKKVQLAYDY